MSDLLRQCEYTIRMFLLDCHYYTPPNHADTSFNKTGVFLMSPASRIVLFSITLVMETFKKRQYLESHRSEGSHGALDIVGNNLKEPHIATLSCFLWYAFTPLGCKRS